MPEAIALVDNDPISLTSFAKTLERENFGVYVYSDPVDALRCLPNNRIVDLVVMESKLSNADNSGLLVQLRHISNVPVILVSDKFDEIDEISGLRMGADDYVLKSASQSLLIERIRTVLRRYRFIEDSGRVAESKQLGRGELVLDLTRHLCLWQNRPVILTAAEMRILHCLAQRPGIIKSRNQLIDAAYDMDNDIFDRSIDSHIKRLRRKFQNVDRNFSHIESTYGLGYKFIGT